MASGDLTSDILYVDSNSPTGIVNSLNFAVNDMTFNGYGESFGTGIVGPYCLTLDGTASDDEIPAQVASSTELSKLGNTYTDYTLSFWAKSGDQFAYLARLIQCTSNYAFAVRENSSDKISFSVYDGTNNPVIYEDEAHTDGEWNHYVCSRDTTRGVITMWKNLTEQTAVADTTVSANVTNSSGIEVGNTGGPTRAWAGSLDDFRVFKRLLNPQERKALNEKKDVRDGLIVHYTFNEGTGSTVKNKAAIGNVPAVTDDIIILNAGSGNQLAILGVQRE